MRLVTAKPAPYARQVLRHFDIEPYFDGVHAPTLADRTRTKTMLVFEALKEIGTASGVVMVGDRADDIVAAHGNGVPCIAVAWGYGSGEEVSAAGVDAQATTSVELLTHVERLAPRNSI
jgi:phosphoglycolate phosphatase